MSSHEYHVIHHLSRKEFKLFLTELQIHFSNKRWRQIFGEIDKNFDNEISFDELFLFLFPDHDEAKVSEETIHPKC